MRIKNKILKYGLAIAFLGGIGFSATAQSVGSSATYTGLGIAGGVFSTVNETVYIGPGAYDINGDWEIYSKNVWISPDATFTGTGKMIFKNPIDAGAPAASRNFVDGNKSTTPLGLNIEVGNDIGIELMDVSLAGDLSSWTDAATASTIYADKNIDFSIDNGNIYLGAMIDGNLVLSSNATLSGYNQNRMVVTNNSIVNHLVKEGLSGSFVFPVGIDANDYTPAQLNSVSSNTLSVSVQDYAASIPDEDLTSGTIDDADGMQRTWHIFGNTAGVSTTLTLQHNNSTNQAGFNTTSNYITQWSDETPNSTGDNVYGWSTSKWQTNNPLVSAVGNLIDPSGAVAGSSMISRIYTSLPTTGIAEQSYFTKSSDLLHPLSLQITDFVISNNDCKVDVKWKTANESGVATFEVYYSKDGIAYEKVGEVAPNGGHNGYAFHHPLKYTGTVFFKVAVLKDAKRTYTQVKTLQVNCLSDQYSTFPVPTRSNLSVKGLNTNKAYQLAVYNLNGQLVKLSQVLPIDGIGTVDITELPTANYILKVSLDEQQVYQAVIVKD
jgi:hypothetical protein